VKTVETTYSDAAAMTPHCQTAIPLSIVIYDELRHVAVGCSDVICSVRLLLRGRVQRVYNNNISDVSTPYFVSRKLLQKARLVFEPRPCEVSLPMTNALAGVVLVLTPPSSVSSDL